MGAAPCISQIASLLAEPKRTAMLWALMDGSAKSSDELQRWPVCRRRQPMHTWRG